jgi:hypothetical protein
MCGKVNSPRPAMASIDWDAIRKTMEQRDAEDSASRQRLERKRAEYEYLLRQQALQNDLRNANPYAPQGVSQGIAGTGITGFFGGNVYQTVPFGTGTAITGGPTTTTSPEPKEDPRPEPKPPGNRFANLDWDEGK